MSFRSSAQRCYIWCCCSSSASAAADSPSCQDELVVRTIFIDLTIASVSREAELQAIFGLLYKKRSLLSLRAHSHRFVVQRARYWIAAHPAVSPAAAGGVAAARHASFRRFDLPPAGQSDAPQASPHEVSSVVTASTSQRCSHSHRCSLCAIVT